jgi:type II secretory pathway predicted ATPase ExeA
LQEKPFKISTDPKFLWLGDKHKEALETLRYGILYGDGYVAVTGDVGTGKTTLASALANDLSDKVIIAKIPHPDVDTLDFLRLISTAYGIQAPFEGKGSFLVHFESFLRRSFSAGKKVVLIIDEAQGLSHGHIEELLHLSNIEENGTRLLNIVFVGQNEFNAILLEESNRALRQRVVIHHNLAALTQDETRQYILHRLKVAQCDREIFTAEAVLEIFSYSRGIPRLINILCDLALLMTYFERAERVQAETVRQCEERLRLPNEKVDFSWTGIDRSLGTGEKVSDEIGDKRPEEVSGEIVTEKKKPVRVGSVVAAAIVSLITLLGLALFLHRYGGIQRNSTYKESEKQVSQAGSSPQGKIDAVKELGTPGTASSTIKEAAFSVGAGKGPEPSARGKDSSGLEEVRKPKRAKSIGDVEKSASENRGRKVIQTPGTTMGPSLQKTSGQEAEEVEPSKVIDWLIEKRSEKK